MRALCNYRLIGIARQPDEGAAPRTTGARVGDNGRAAVGATRMRTPIEGETWEWRACASETAGQDNQFGKSYRAAAPRTSETRTRVAWALCGRPPSLRRPGARAMVRAHGARAWCARIFAASPRRSLLDRVSGVIAAFGPHVSSSWLID